MVRITGNNYLFAKFLAIFVFISSFWSLAISFPFIIESIGIMIVMFVQGVIGIESTFLNLTKEYTSNYGFVFVSSLILFFNGWFGFVAATSFYRKSKNFKKFNLIYLLISCLGLILLSFSLSLIDFAYLTQIRFVNSIFLFLSLLTILYFLLKKE